jgi:1,4-alpha-glucan branching enzyme
LREVGEGWWSLTKELPRGAFAYQYLIDKRFVVCDPYARFVAEDPGDAPRKAIVRPRQEGYHWRHDHWRRPRFQDLMIYEMHIADFTPQRDFREAVGYLDRVRDLGVNAIELMPVFGVHENKGWGYTPTFLFAPNEDYGTTAELKWFIDDAHGKGMAVILDMVLAHTGHKHPFNQMYPYDQSPWYGTGPAGGNAYGLPQLDYSKQATRRFVQDVLGYWLTEFHVDGYRFDYISSIGVTSEGYGVPTLTWAARSVRHDAYLIGEHLPEDPGLMLFADMSGAWHVRFCHALRALLCQRDVFGYRWDEFESAVRTLDPGHEGYGQRPECMVNYIESRDEQRLILDIQQSGFNAEIARRKSALGASILFTAVGEPMLYHGQSWGQDTPINMDHNYLNWDKLETPGGKGLRDHYARLADLRRGRDALRTSNIAIDRILSEQKCVVYHRWNDAGDEVVVAANFSGHPQRIPVPFPNSGQWKEFFSGHESGYTGTVDIDLDHWAAKIFLRA